MISREQNPSRSKSLKWQTSRDTWRLISSK